MVARRVAGRGDLPCVGQAAAQSAISYQKLYPHPVVILKDLTPSLPIWANRYTAGTGWGTAALIETDNAGNAYSPQIACDTAGNALAVWDQSDGTRLNIWANRFE